MQQQRRIAEAEGGNDEGTAVGNWLQSRKMLDLDDLAFSQGSHLMSNKVFFTLFDSLLSLFRFYKKIS